MTTAERSALVARSRGVASGPRSRLLLRLPDQIALPDFFFGAMENWGLVTYRERKLLYHPDTSSARDKEATVTIVAHELAHMVTGPIPAGEQIPVSN